jgi:hypothetical protein
MKLFILLIILALTGYENSTPTLLPLKESDVKRLMAEKMDIIDWQFSKDGDSYSFSSVPNDPLAEGVTLIVNGKTGTVYEEISGLPEYNLVVKNSPNLSNISNGPVYSEEMTKLAMIVLDKNGLVPDTSIYSEWISGGYVDGYIFGDVKKDNKKMTIKIDIFTGEWGEIKIDG